MLKLIVCDWDGTLADSVAKIIFGKKVIAERYQLEVPTEEKVKEVLGIQFEEALAQCFPGANAKQLSQLGHEFHTLMQEDEFQATLFPGAYAVLEHFKERGIKLAIATSKARIELNKALISNRLENYFERVCCGKEYQEKPNPAMLHFLLKEFDLEPSECLMVGDTTTDIEFAQNAGVRIVCVTFGAHPKTKLHVMNPYAMIDEWKQLVEVTERLCSSTEMSYPL